MKKTTEILKKHNIKITRSRIAVLELFIHATEPLDAATIVSAIKQKKLAINRSTIFRILGVFKNSGLIKTFALNEGKLRYELANTPEHHHILCTICGAIKDVDICIDKTTQKQIEESTGYKINTHMLEFTGICAKCAY